MKKSKVAILGASDKPDRYSNILIRRLKASGHDVYPIHPTLKSIEGFPVYPAKERLPVDVDVLSIYMRKSRSEELAETILSSGIPKVVFNPGAENPPLMKRLREKGVDAMEACSLVLHSMNNL